MSIVMDWDNAEKTIIRITVSGKWEGDDLQPVITKGMSMMASVNHAVDTIFDLTRSTGTPTSALSILGQVESIYSDHARLLIAVKPSSYLKTLFNIGRKLAPKTFANLVFVSTVSEAYAAIAKLTTPASPTAFAKS